MCIKSGITDLKVENNNSIKENGEITSGDFCKDSLAVLDMLPNLVWRSDTDGKRNYFNQSWLAFTGRTFEQEMGDGWAQGIHPEDQERYSQVCQESLEKRQPFEVAYRLRHHDGEYRWILDTARPYQDGKGNFLGFMGSCVDISQRKQMEKELADLNAVIQKNEVELQKNEVALRKSEAMFKGLFEYAPDAIIAFDGSGTIQLANQKAEQVLGSPRAEIIGKTVDTVLFAQRESDERHADQLRAFIANIAHRPMTSAVANVCLVLSARRVDGTRFPADVHLGLLETDDYSLVVATISDSTERRQAEAAIREREKLLLTAASSAPLVFFKVDKNGILQLSLGKSLARQMNGEDPIGKSIYTLYKNVPDVIRGIERALKGETFTTVIETGENTYEATYAPVLNERGEVTSVIGVASDVTRHREVEAALRESEAHFRTIFNDTVLGIKLIDPIGRIVETNPALQEMLGYTADELQRMTFQDLTYPEDTPIMTLLLNNLLSGKMDHFRVEKRYLHKNGQVIWGKLAMSLFRRHDGTPVFGIGMIENITPQKQAEAELAELQRRMIDSAEMERLNLAQELHDGPLQDLQSIAFETAMLENMIQDPEGLAELQQLQEEVHKVSQSLRTVCGDLRPPALTPFGLEKTLRSHAERFKEQHPDINVQLDLMNDGKLLSERVRLALFRIYQHAMANILRHSQAKNVRISFGFDDNEIRLRIQDDGKGFKVPNRWIALVREGHFGIVGSIERAESVGGKFEIRSKPGTGTEINVVVPRREEEQIAVRERFRASYSE